MIRRRQIHLYIISREEQFILEREDLPTIFVEHNPTIEKTEHFMDDKSIQVMWNAKGNNTWKKQKGISYLVYPDIVSFPSLKYNGRKKEIIQVCKGMERRPIASGLDTWREITDGLPCKIVGRFNEGMDESIGYLDYKGMRRLYADSRVYLDTKLYWHSTAVQEALLTGMPVVTTDLTAPFKNEKEIIKSRDTVYLRKRIKELLSNPKECKEIGERGRKAYLSRLPTKEWKRVWELGFVGAIDLYKKRKRDLVKDIPLDRLLSNRYKS